MRHPKHPLGLTAAAVAALLVAMAGSSVGQQPERKSQAASPAAPAAPPANLVAGSIEKLTGVWVEGPGYDVSYGGDYEGCAQRCLATPKCVMIEYYRPERKCNLYSSPRPRKAGGSSFVSLRKPPSQ